MPTLWLVFCKNQSLDNNRISSVFDHYYTERLSLYPLDATFNGETGYNQLLPNSISAAFKIEERNFYTKYLDLLKHFNYMKLSDKDQLSYDILKWECEIHLEGLKFHYELIPINQFQCLPLVIGQLACGKNAQPFKTVKDYHNWLLRLDAFVVWCDTAIENMKLGMKQGYVLPKALVEKVIPQMADLAKGPVENNLFYNPILSLPTVFPQIEKDTLKAAYKLKIENKIIPTFTNLKSFFTKEYLTHSSEVAGLSALPDGKDYYAYLIKYYTTTNLTADEIFEIGNKEVERIWKEMEIVKEQVGYKGDLISFFNFVRNNKQLMPYKSAEQVIDHFKQIHQSIELKLKDLFDIKPRTKFEIRQTETFRNKSASAEYIQGSFDGSRPGIFYVPVPEVFKYNNFADEDLFLHEAIPGHHYQISLQQEDTTLPIFHRGSWYCAYGEGWALYCESLGKELGLYSDPYQYFGYLSWQMHRSIRLVVDVGIHSKGWTREQAIDYSLKHEAESESLIISEIERYMAMPGQALSYKIGQLKISQLRHKAENALGSKFNIKQFHNQILESGCMPLMLLEQKINKWIEKQLKTK